jgi:glycine/D-amino acid oxidase-like deaminating enzyme
MGFRISHYRRAEVTVLGAGMTGVGTALELARQGVHVTLVDQDPHAVNRASLRNEGKIHLGFIYANDRTLATARLQLDGALSFRALLHRWIGRRVETLPLSTPFVYLVARDSLLTMDELEQHYAAIDSIYRERLRLDPTTDYLGRRPARLYDRCPTGGMPRPFSKDNFMGAFLTQELAIDTDALAQALRGAVTANNNIDFLPEHKVVSLERADGRLRIEGTKPNGTWRIDSDQVVNALWENRIAFDRMIGVDCPTGWVHRLKYRVIAQIPAKLREGPSATMVLRPYGDVVVRPDGTAYLSWYPVGLQGWTHETSPPDSWNAPCRGEGDEAKSRSLAHAIIGAIDAWYPGMGESRPIVIDAGVIVAYGKTDVGDAASALHDRTQVGVSSFDGYHSVDPGKLTTAPLFALRAAERVLKSRIDHK